MTALPQEYLSEEAMHALLVSAVGKVRCQKVYAALHNIDPSRLSRVLHKKDNVGPQIAAALGYQITHGYMPLTFEEELP